MAPDTRNCGATATASRCALVVGAVLVSLALLLPWDEIMLLGPSWGDGYDRISFNLVRHGEFQGPTSTGCPVLHSPLRAFRSDAASTVAVRHFRIARTELVPRPRLPSLPGGDLRNLPGVRSTHVGRGVPGFVRASGHAGPTRRTSYGRPVRGNVGRRVRPDLVPGWELDGFHRSRRRTVALVFQGAGLVLLRHAGLLDRFSAAWPYRVCCHYVASTTDRNWRV